MAVFASTTTVGDTRLCEIIGTDKLPNAQWESIKERVVQGGKHIINLRGRSSFQSPSYLSIKMIAAAMGGEVFKWPAGVYVNTEKYQQVLMAMETTISEGGIVYKEVKGTTEENNSLPEIGRASLRERGQAIG